MKKVIIIFTIILICSCKSLPAIQPVPTESLTDNNRNCYCPFPEGNWQFIHSIEATMPNGKTAVIIGITNIYSRTGEIKTVIMTIEGLVLFDAEYDKQIRVHKSISPFDTVDFAEGLMKDVKLIFLHPEEGKQQNGYLENGSFVCRYYTENGVLDIILHEDKTWEIKKYNHHNKLIRSVKTTSVSSNQMARGIIPEEIELTSNEKHNYSLMLDLIEARRISN